MSWRRRPRCHGCLGCHVVTSWTRKVAGPGADRSAVPQPEQVGSRGKFWDILGGTFSGEYHPLGGTLSGALCKGHFLRDVVSTALSQGYSFGDMLSGTRVWEFQLFSIRQPSGTQSAGSHARKRRSFVKI